MEIVEFVRNAPNLKSLEILNPRIFFGPGNGGVSFSTDEEYVLEIIRSLSSEMERLKHFKIDIARPSPRFVNLIYRNRNFSVLSSDPFGVMTDADWKTHFENGQDYDYQCEYTKIIDLQRRQ